MVFKLVRVDSEEPCKIQLPVGTHVVGRGKLFDCEDKRVSRRHGEVVVTNDSVTIKALHQNPFFYTKKGTKETEILEQGNEKELNNGDRFGLLPDVQWYELVFYTDLTSSDNDRENGLQDNNMESIQNVNTRDVITQAIDERIETVNEMFNLPEQNVISNESEQNVTSNLELQSTTANKESEENVVKQITHQDSDKTCCSDDELVNFDLNETVEAGPESPSLINAASPSYTQTTSANNGAGDESPTQNYLNPVPLTPTKRSHSPDNAADAKKIKTEPDVKTEVKMDPDGATPGPSNNQGGASSSDAKDGDGKTDGASPAKPAAPLRERCMYGASCYRRNPQHKVQFSHPADADWGGGARGVCPYGAACRKRDPRHWRDHDHPPGVAPPPPAHPPAQPQPAAAKRQRPKKTSSDEEDSLRQDLIVTGKRPRKPVRRPSYSSESEDPFQTDDFDEWLSGGQLHSQDTQTQTQDF